MSRTCQDGHGRCGACGDAGEGRRVREAAWFEADQVELPAELEPEARACPEGCLCGYDPTEANEYLETQDRTPLAITLATVLK